MGTLQPVSSFYGTIGWVCFALLGAAAIILMLREMILDEYTHVESTPTGSTKVLYENDLDIVLLLYTGGLWVNIQNVDTLFRLINYPNKYRVFKDGVAVEVPNVEHTEYIEKSGYSVYQDYRRLANIRIDSITLVEMEDVTTLQIGKRISKCLERNIYNKVVVEYEVTNVTEVEQGILEDKQRKRAKDQTKEELQQFVTPTKGE